LKPKSKKAPKATAPAKVSRLTPKQERFCQEYLIDLNATQAAARAGYKAKNPGSLRVIAHLVLAKEEVQKRILDLRDAQATRTEITADRIVEELGRIAFIDIADFLEWDGKRFKIKALADLTKEQRAAIAEFNEKLTAAGITHGIKFHDKLEALQLLGKRFGLFKDQLEVSGKDGAPVAVQIYLPDNGRSG
jgi:phage terminase small subunit